MPVSLTFPPAQLWKIPIPDPVRREMAIEALTTQGAQLVELDKGAEQAEWEGGIVIAGVQEDRDAAVAIIDALDPLAVMRQRTKIRAANAALQVLQTKYRGWQLTGLVTAGATLLPMAGDGSFMALDLTADNRAGWQAMQRAVSWIVALRQVLDDELVRLDKVDDLQELIDYVPEDHIRSPQASSLPG